MGDVTATIAPVGSGFFVIMLLHGVQLVLDGMGWRALLGRERRPAAGTFVWGRWLAESVNDLLPVMQVGGNVVRARALADAGVAGPTAGASVVVDMTVIMATQLSLTLVGLCLLVVYFDAGAVVGRVIAGVVVTAGMLAGLILAQRRGLFSAGVRLLERLVQTPAQLALALELGGARRGAALVSIGTGEGSSPPARGTSRRGWRARPRPGSHCTSWDIR